MIRSENSTDISLRRRLKRATESLHARVEARLDLERDTLRENDYVALLARFLGFYSPLELRLSRLDWGACGIDFARRTKSRWIEADLVDFNLGAAAVASLPQCRILPPTETVRDGIGVLYVLEGSTLGGQVILRRLGPKLGIGPGFGGRFFASYGPDIGPMWRDYIAVLERFGQTRSAADAIEQAAFGAFRTLDDWLSQSIAVASPTQCSRRQSSIGGEIASETAYE
jgi:heme oxygenase (biliverdin-IX-beta and delta-forming)